VNRRWAVGVVAAALVAIALPARAATPTTTKSQVDTKLKTLTGQIQEAGQEESALLKKIDAANAKKKSAEAQLASLVQQLPAAQAALDAANVKLGQADSELAAAQSDLDAANDRLDGGRSGLKQRAIDAYMGQDMVLAGDLHITNMRDYVAVQEYLKAAARAHRQVVDHYDTLQKSAAQLADTVSRRRNEVKAQHDEVSRATAALNAAKATQERAHADAISAAADAAALLKQVRSRRAEFQSQYNQLKAQSDAIARLLKGRQSGQGVAPSGHGTLSVPIPGAPITDTFGPRVHPIFGDVRMHTGIDFGAAEGTPIHAAADGVVASAGVQGGYGNATIIDHGNSLATLYAHQSRMIVSTGQHVTRGQVIGYVGHTGYATGPHLHFEVRVNGTPVDPLPYL
jgi:murein DD-endopeptidase MepM/ murein hydrolase activator NlpD